VQFRRQVEKDRIHFLTGDLQLVPDHTGLFHGVHISVSHSPQ